MGGIGGRGLRPAAPRPKDWPKSREEEKGIDVHLAVDLLYNGVRHNHDIAIVASTDTDLVPALEAVCDLRRAWGKPRLEVVAWFNPADRKRLSVAGYKVWCHQLSKAHYESVQDKLTVSEHTFVPSSRDLRTHG